MNRIGLGNAGPDSFEGDTVIYVGTCGFSYKEWIGPFYPAKIKPAEMLPYYAREFRAVEIDSSYYGVPSPRTTESMAGRTPADFRFSFKMPQTRHARIRRRSRAARGRAGISRRAWNRFWQRKNSRAF